MSKQREVLVRELGQLWNEYLQLAESSGFPTQYQSFDPSAYDGEGCYEPGAEGFIRWIAAGAPNSFYRRGEIL